MDLCPFVRIIVKGLTIKVPKPAKHSISGGVLPSSSSSSPCFCKIKLNNFPTQYADVSITPFDEDSLSVNNSLAACFNLSKTQIDRLKSPCLKIEIFSGQRREERFKCATRGTPKMIGRVLLPLSNLSAAESRACFFHHGWIEVGECKNNIKGWAQAEGLEFHLSVRAEPDPRFVFEFDGEPECSPQVYQVQPGGGTGTVKQPVFSCKFSFRNERDWNQRPSSSISESISGSRWLTSFRPKKDRPTKERKGWSITVHDLFGSPVAAASMVTPFVPSGRSHLVSQSNPGAWLILRPEDGIWNPWGRLEAWRDCSNGSDSVNFRFKLLPATAAAATLATTSISARRGGKFSIDMTHYMSPVSSAQSSCDLGSGSCGARTSSSGSEDLWYLAPYLNKGFVMSSTVEGLGKCSKPKVEVGAQYVTCTEDAAAFVALAAAMDLSMDACISFSKKLRKELRH